MYAGPFYQKNANRYRDLQCADIKQSGVGDGVRPSAEPYPFEIKELLSDRELKVCKRARNTHSTVPKSATVEEYRESTAFEGLLGYLYLSRQKERLDFLMGRGLSYLEREFHDE